jgi:protein involved in temperature-dependent protein secretion
MEADPLDVESVRQAAAAEEQGQAEEAQRLQERALKLDGPVG